MSINTNAIQTQLLLKASKKSAMVAALLSLLFPGLGYFYVGKTGTGIVTLFTTLILFVIIMPIGAVLWLMLIITSANAAQVHNLEIKKQINALDKEAQ